MTEQTETEQTPWRPQDAEDLRAGVAQALGAASVAWDPRPEGVFRSEEASRVLDGLMAWMEDEGYADVDGLTPEGLRLWAAQEAAKVLRASSVISSASVDPYQVIALAEWIVEGPQGTEVTEETTIAVEGDDEVAPTIVNRREALKVWTGFSGRSGTSLTEDFLDTLDALGIKVVGD